MNLNDDLILLTRLALDAEWMLFLLHVLQLGETEYD